MRNQNKLFCPNGQLLVKDQNQHEGDFCKISFLGEEIRFSKLFNGDTDLLLRDNFAEYVFSYRDPPLKGRFTAIALENGVVLCDRN